MSMHENTIPQAATGIGASNAQNEANHEIHEASGDDAKLVFPDDIDEGTRQLVLSIRAGRGPANLTVDRIVELMDVANEIAELNQGVFDLPLEDYLDRIGPEKMSRLVFVWERMKSDVEAWKERARSVAAKQKQTEQKAGALKDAVKKLLHRAGKVNPKTNMPFLDLDDGVKIRLQRHKDDSVRWLGDIRTDLSLSAIFSVDPETKEIVIPPISQDAFKLPYQPHLARCKIVFDVDKEKVKDLNRKGLPIPDGCVVEPNIYPVATRSGKKEG